MQRPKSAQQRINFVSKLPFQHLVSSKVNQPWFKASQSAQKAVKRESKLFQSFPFSALSQLNSESPLIQSAKGQYNSESENDVYYVSFSLPSNPEP